MAGLNELQAVNLMLSNIGETPVATLTGSGDAYVSIAQTILSETTRAVQEEGWEFNTDKDYEITPDVDNFILIADNVITMDTIPGGIDVTVRQGKLYNKEDHTFLFTETSYLVEILWEFDYVDTPQYIRQYMAIRAARTFSDRMQGDDLGAKLSADDEQHALIVAKRHDHRNSDRTIFSDSTIYRLKHRGN